MTDLTTTHVSHATVVTVGGVQPAAPALAAENATLRQHIATLTEALSMAATELEAATYFAAAEYCRTALAAASQP